MNINRERVQKRVSANLIAGVTVIVGLGLGIPHFANATEVFHASGSGKYVIAHKVTTAQDGCRTDVLGVYVHENSQKYNRETTTQNIVSVHRGSFDYCTGIGYSLVGDLVNPSVQYRGRLNGVSVNGSGILSGWDTSSATPQTIVSQPVDVAIDLVGSGELTQGSNSTVTDLGPVRISTKSDGANREGTATGNVRVGNDIIDITDAFGFFSESKYRSFTLTKQNIQ